MSVWIMIWKVVFVIALAAFAVLAVGATIGGARDVVSLLNKLKQDRSNTKSDNQGTLPK